MKRTTISTYRLHLPAWTKFQTQVREALKQVNKSYYNLEPNDLPNLFSNRRRYSRCSSGGSPKNFLRKGMGNNLIKYKLSQSPRGRNFFLSKKDSFFAEFTETHTFKNDISSIQSQIFSLADSLKREDQDHFYGI